MALEPYQRVRTYIESELTFDFAHVFYFLYDVVGDAFEAIALRLGQLQDSAILIEHTKVSIFISFVDLKRNHRITLSAITIALVKAQMNGVLINDSFAKFEAISECK